MWHRSNVGSVTYANDSIADEDVAFLGRDAAARDLADEDTCTRKGGE